MEFRLGTEQRVYGAGDVVVIPGGSAGGLQAPSSCREAALACSPSRCPRNDIREEMPVESALLERFDVRPKDLPVPSGQPWRAVSCRRGAHA
jgi:hypothetical protein